MAQGGGANGVEKLVKYGVKKGVKTDVKNAVKTDVRKRENA